MIPENSIQTSSNYAPTYTITTTKSTLYVISGGHGAFNSQGMPLIVYRFDLGIAFFSLLIHLTSI